MAQMLSPGVYIEEVDASAIVPSVSANVAFFAGNFNNGPVDQPYVVTNRQEYRSIFGVPTDRNYNEWFQGYKFFDYGNQLIVTRAFKSAPETEIDLTNPPESLTSEDAVQIYTYNGDLPAPTSQINKVLQGRYIINQDPLQERIPVEVIQEDDGTGVMVDTYWDAYLYFSTNLSPDIELGDGAYIGDSLAPGEVLDFTSDPAEISGDPFSAPTGTLYRYKIRYNYNPTFMLSAVTTDNFYTVEIDSSASEYREIQINEKHNFKADVGDIVGVAPRDSDNSIFEYYGVITKIENRLVTIPGAVEQTYANFIGINFYTSSNTAHTSQAIYLIYPEHKNGGVQAYRRGDVEASGEPVIKTIAVDPILNVDTPNSDQNANRLNYTYDIIKNTLDFENKKSNNEINSFMDGMKLKFYSKFPDGDLIEIAIANAVDFETDQDNNSNYAVAFYERENGIKVNNPIYLTSLFDYAPTENQIAIAIKKGDAIETFIVSMNPNSVDGNFKNNYIENVINERSKFVYVIDNVAIDDVPATYLETDRHSIFAENTETQVLEIKGGKNPKVNGAQLLDAYMTVEDKERFEIDVVIGNEEYQAGAITLAETRKDCIAYIGARYEDCVGFKANVATNKLLDYMKSPDAPQRTMFASFFANYFRIYDNFNKKYRWINVAGDMSGIRCDVTSSNAPWWVSAGMKRGIIRNINKLAFTPSQAQRDNLYKNSMNPIVNFPGTGNLVWGNKTLLSYASSFDRINVRTLFNTLERSMAKAARSQVFEFNDPYTRNAILSMFNPYLATIKAGRGITDYLVVCDETNNTPDVISRNELRVDIYIKPNYAAEMILLTFTNVGTRSFADVVGV